MFKRHKKSTLDPVERLLKPTLDMVYNLDRTEFNRWLDGVKLLYDGTQKFRKVQTIEEKEYADIDKTEKSLEYIKANKKEKKEKEKKK